MKAAKDDALTRPNCIEGHLRGIRKMVEEDTYCVDILKQSELAELFTLARR